MKQIVRFNLLAIMLMTFACAFAQDTYKTVTLDWGGTSILWKAKTNLVPSYEPFNIKVSNAGTTGSMELEIFETTGKVESKVGKGISRGKYTVAVANGTCVILMDKTFSFRRFYILEFTYSPSGGGTQTKTMKVYSTAPNDELSWFQAYSGFGGIGFAQDGVKQPRASFGFATGLKIKWRPNSTNKNIDDPYKLYPRSSRFSCVIGAVVNDVKYKSSNIKAAVIGIKPLLALDWEFSRHVGVTLGTMIGNQDITSKLNSENHPVFGLWLSISFSADLFTALKNGVPFDKIPK
ncbi:MAG: hypothetical protein K0S33_3712 [Bacteroidetes bacterium]|jgi:hypothetical protein|nr:hypothetical protein [Bacteroidota bacterium]